MTEPFTIEPLPRPLRGRPAMERAEMEALVTRTACRTLLPCCYRCGDPLLVAQIVAGRIYCPSCSVFVRGELRHGHIR